MPRRRPSSNIPINISTRRQLSSDAKSEIYGRAAAGESACEIESAEKVPKSTIEHVLQRIEQRNTTADLPRSGRPCICNNRDQWHIIRQVRLSPKIKYEELRRATGLEFRREVLRCILQDHGIAKWRSKRRPALTQEVASMRLSFTRAWIDHNWFTVLFSVLWLST